MPRRIVPFVDGEIYHVFNRSIAGDSIFSQKPSLFRALDLLDYYRFEELTLRFSHFRRMTLDQKLEYRKKLSKQKVDILAFCLMPTHFHFLVRQNIDNGIPSFIANFQNSFAKYFNLRNDRTGSLFQSMFKARRIESDNQLLQAARYVHLNPLTSYLIRNLDDLAKYTGDSYQDYLGLSGRRLIETKTLLSFYKDVMQFTKFTADQVDYQRKLKNIKQLIIEK